MFNKIIFSKQNKAADAYTVLNEPVSSIDLMERASKLFIKTVLPLLRPEWRIIVACGRGNNGGDGLAIARILKSKGFCVDVFIVQASLGLSPDCAANLSRVTNVLLVEPESDLPTFVGYDVIIDSLLGSGLSRPTSGLYATIIDLINDATAQVFAVDVPSGWYCDSVVATGSVVKSDLVVSFQRPKLSFFYPESGKYIKHWTVVDIGLDETFIESQPSPYFMIDESVCQLVKTRERFSHKGTYGHACIIGGSYGKMGAAILAAKACLRSGAGLVTAYVPSFGVNPMHVAVPEVMCLPRSAEGVNDMDWTMFSSVGIGPGLGTDPDSLSLLHNILSISNLPLVLDADALNLLAMHKEMLNDIPENTVITPHPKEFERLVGKWHNSDDRTRLQLEFAKKYKCIVVLKDAYTCIATPEGNVYFNSTGNAGMATAGSGDVLTGIIAGLLAQGYSPLDAALIGVCFHGKAGDKCAADSCQTTVIASDIIDALRIAP